MALYAISGGELVKQKPSSFEELRIHERTNTRPPCSRLTYHRRLSPVKVASFIPAQLIS